MNGLSLNFPRSHVKTAALAAFLPVLAVSAAVSPADYPDADCVTVDERTKIEYQADGTYTAETDEYTLALTEKGRRSLLTVSVDVSRRYGDAEIVKVEIIGKDNSVQEVNFRSSLNETSENSSVAENIFDPFNRRISCSVPGIKIGEMRRVVTRKRINRPRMRNVFATQSLFESQYPIIRSSLEITAPADRPLSAIKLRHPLGETVRRHPDRHLPDGRIIYSWTAENVPQAFPEPDMPPFASVAQSLLVSTCPSWEEVSKWYWRLCRPRLEATDAAITGKVQELVRDLAGREAKIRALFRFVSQEVRYMGLTLEDESPGYAPHDVRLTFKNRYGVCRDKAALLVSMLRIAGFEAYPALINVGAKMDEKVPLPFFNHAVVWCGELMDPTNEGTHDLLPAYLSGCSYLVAHPEGRALAAAPVKPSSANAFSAQTVGSLAPDGSALVSTRAQFGGINDLYRQSLLKLTPSDRRRTFEVMLQTSFPGAEMLSFELLPRDLRDTDNMLQVEFSAHIPDLVIRGKTGDELKLPFIFTGRTIAEGMLSGRVSLDERRYPLTLVSTAASEELLTLKTGEALGEALGGGMNGRIRFPGGEYLQQARWRDHVISAKRRWEINTVEIDREDYPEVKYALKKIETQSRRRPRFAILPGTAEADTRTRLSRTEISLKSPFSWTVTNTWQKEILTYAGKKANSELAYSFNPLVGRHTIVSACVSNRNGVLRVSPSEINLLDADWADSAPRYPASKTLVVNLPGVETGSVISVTTAAVITNSPIGYCNLFEFDSVDPSDIRELRIGGVPLKILQPRISDEIRETDSFFHAVTNPPCLPREPNTPPPLLWRDCALISAADLNQYRDALYSALERARTGGSDLAAAQAERLTRNLESPEEKIAAIREWLCRNVRISGPGLLALPFDRAFFPPDRSLTDAYASRTDWMNLFFTMLKAAGFEVEFILTDNDNSGHPAVRRARTEVPQPDEFVALFIRATARKGALWGIFGGDRREFILACENEYTPIGVRNLDGRDRRAENFMSIDLNETGAARITVSNSVWGTDVGILRKRYAEMLPEMRARHHAELIGDIAESGEAISDLNVNTEDYPFTLTYSVYVPNYAFAAGNSLSLEVPGLGGSLLPAAGARRKNPLLIRGRNATVVTIREVTFPEGFSRIEHLPEPWEMLLPGEREPRGDLTVKRLTEDGRLKVIFREELTPMPDSALPAVCQGFVRAWNRRTGSPSGRTVSASRTITADAPGASPPR